MAEATPARAALKRTGVLKAVIVRAEPGGLSSSTILYEKREKRRVSKRMRGLDKAVRRISLARKVAADEFFERSQRSSGKKKNGVLRDLLKNIVKSQRKGRKKLKLRLI